MQQESFLFDSDDPKQTGKGVDKLRRPQDCLKADWKWCRGKGARMPHTNRRCVGQVSETRIGKNGEILLEAIFWHTHYEARVTWLSEHLINYDEKTSPLLTRIDAQKKAEHLARKFCQNYTKMLNEAGL